MQTAPKQSAEALRAAVASYVRALPVPALDERAIAARREAFARAPAARRPVRRRAALAVAAAALAAILAFDAPAVVAGMQHILAAFSFVGGRPVPMSVRVVDLAEARADVPFELIVPPPVPGTALTVREILSSAAPAGDSVVFELHRQRPGADISIVETRDGGGPRHVYVTEGAAGRGVPDVPSPVAPPVHTGDAGSHVAVVGNLGSGAFVPLTWVTRGTRIVLLGPPGALSAAQVRAIRAAMSD